MRSRALLALSVPLAAAGCLTGHAVGYALAGTSARDAAVHGYLGHAPQFLAACLALVAAVVSLRAAGRLEGRLSALPFAVLPPLAFCLQELLERLLGGVPVHSVVEPAVLVGLAAQLPLALAAFLVARALLRCADTLRETLVRGSPPSLGRPVLIVAAAAVSTRVVPPHASRLGRAPPAR